MITLIRGLPGSGKSTLAKQMMDDAVAETIHVESDEWFVTKYGYKFDFRDLSTAHEWCVSHTEGAIRKGIDVIVSNTFTVEAECVPYYVIASKYKVDFNLITLTEDFGSIHDVPDDIYNAMKKWFVSDEDVFSYFEGIDISDFLNKPYASYKHYSGQVH